MSEQYSYSLKFALDGLVRCGVDVGALLDSLDLDRSFSSQHAAPISLALWCDLLDEAVAQTGNPNIGLIANLEADLADYGSLGYALLNAEDLFQVLEVISTYINLSQDGLEIKHRFVKDTCVVEVAVTDWRQPVHRTSIDWALSCGIAFVRSWYGGPLSPKTIHVMYDQPVDTSAYQKCLCCPVEFGQSANAMIFDRSMLKQAKPSADHRLFSILRDDLNRTLEKLLSEPCEEDLTNKVQREIAALIANGAPSIDQVAGKLNISARTLQRRLSDDGCTFKQLTENVRSILAKNYMNSHNYSLVDTAFLLGYSEVSAFIRAFRRWTGMTPMQYRDQNDS